jgi:hypothetical protein
MLRGASPAQHLYFIYFCALYTWCIGIGGISQTYLVKWQPCVFHIQPIDLSLELDNLFSLYLDICCLALSKKSFFPEYHF